MLKRTTTVVCLLAIAIHAQTRIDLRTQASEVVDFGNATFTRPVRTGANLPSVCRTGEFFFKTDAPPGSNLYGCVSTNQWVVIASGTSLPAGGDTGQALWTDETGLTWKSITTGGTGAVELQQNDGEVSFDIVGAVVPQKHTANVFSGLNTFGLGVQLSPQEAPANPENGRIWYDATLQKFRCRENGVTTDCITSPPGAGGIALPQANGVLVNAGSGQIAARTLTGSNGIVVTNGDGAAGNPTISAGPELLKTDTAQPASTALMGPVSGSAGAPSFRALEDTDLPASTVFKGAANIFTNLNTFSSGLQLDPQAAPENPGNGRIWYDAALQKFRCQENGVTTDCIPTASKEIDLPQENGLLVNTGSGEMTARALTGSNGIVVTNGDGVNGDPTISAGPELLTTDVPQPARTALMGPVSGTDGTPSFRALAEADLPSTTVLKGAANVFTNLNTFTSGIQLQPQAAPAVPADGQIWFDSQTNSFQGRQNGEVVQMGVGMPDPGEDGLVKRTGANSTAAAVAGVDYYAPGTGIRASDMPVDSAYSFWTNMPHGVITGTPGHAGNTLVLRLVRFDARQTFSKVGFYLAGGSDGSRMRIGLYSASCNELLFQTGPIPTSTSANGTVVSGTFTPTTVGPGLYYLAWYGTAGMSALGVNSSSALQILDNSVSSRLVHAVGTGTVDIDGAGLPPTCGDVHPATGSGMATMKIVLSR